VLDGQKVVLAGQGVVLTGQGIVLRGGKVVLSHQPVVLAGQKGVLPGRIAVTDSQRDVLPGRRVVMGGQRGVLRVWRVVVLAGELVLRRLFGARRSVQRDGDGGGGVRAIGASGNSDWGEPAIRIRREKLGKGRRESAPLPCFVRPCCLGGELDLHYQQVRRTGTFDKRLIFCDRPAVS
jgi:hypothetical protein